MLYNYSMANKFEIFRDADVETLTAEAGEYLNTLLSENKNSPVLLLLSAGSALPLLNFVGISSLGPNLTITMLDDRFSQDPAVNNFARLQKTEFYKDALESNANFFGTLPRKDDTLASLANRQDHNLRRWRAENPFGKIIATLGMGPDGHTAGVFPFPEDSNQFHKLFESESWAVGYNVGEKNPHKERVTVTLTFLKQVDYALGFVLGKPKESRLERVIKRQGEVFELPAMAWHRIPNVKLFTDLS